MKFKVRVIKDSVMHQQQVYKKGETFDVDKDIALSLLDREYVEIFDGEGVRKALEEAGGILDLSAKEQLLEMDYNNLKKLAKDLGLNANGKKEEIVERILEFQANEGDADDSEDDGNSEDNGNSVDGADSEDGDDSEEGDDSEDGDDSEEGDDSDGELPNTSMPE